MTPDPILLDVVGRLAAKEHRSRAEQAILDHLRHGAGRETIRSLEMAREVERLVHRRALSRVNAARQRLEAGG